MSMELLGPLWQLESLLHESPMSAYRCCSTSLHLLIRCTNGKLPRIPVAALVADDVIDADAAVVGDVVDVDIGLCHGSGWTGRCLYMMFLTERHQPHRQEVPHTVVLSLPSTPPK